MLSFLRVIACCYQCNSVKLFISMGCCDNNYARVTLACKSPYDHENPILRRALFMFYTVFANTSAVEFGQFMGRYSYFSENLKVVRYAMHSFSERNGTASSLERCWLELLLQHVPPAGRFSSKRGCNGRHHRGGGRCSSRAA